MRNVAGKEKMKLVSTKDLHGLEQDDSCDPKKDKKPEESPMEELKKKLPSVGDAISVVAALAIAAIFFFLFLYFFRGIEYYWLRGVAAMIVTFLCLGAISAAITTPTNLAVPVVIAVFFFFGFSVIKHYADKPKEEYSQEIVSPETIPITPEIQTLEVGSHSFNIEKDQKIGPFQLPSGGRFNYSINSSLDKNWWAISFTDGTSYNGYELTAFPEKDNAVFSIKAIKTQVVTIQVTAQ